ncbi:hypothetical protein EDD18DRAFT_1182886, partial [Armillaria luteobubalina]
FCLPLHAVRFFLLFFLYNICPSSIGYVVYQSWSFKFLLYLYMNATTVSLYSARFYQFSHQYRNKQFRYLRS